VVINIVVLALLASTSIQDVTQFNPGYAQIGMFKISIFNEGVPIPYEVTRYTNLGPMVGDVLNAHYFPGLKLYEAGRYRDAYDQLTYVLNSPNYIDGNPNQLLYLTTAYYLRGMIFLYHASGAGRLTLAKQDFENAIQLNDKNYPAYVELARVFSTGGFKDEAIQVLRHLIEIQPDKDILEKAQRELASLTSESK
jgi:tetratricopeptide (TPR) repeat protein